MNRTMFNFFKHLISHVPGGYIFLFQYNCFLHSPYGTPKKACIAFLIFFNIYIVYVTQKEQPIYTGCSETTCSRMNIIKEKGIILCVL